MTTGKGGVLSGDDRALFIEETLGALADSGEAGFLEGSTLVQRLTGKCPDLVAAVKGQKGWLRKLLDQEPGISVVEVEGKNEPCYCIAGSEDAVDASAQRPKQRKRSAEVVEAGTARPKKANRLSAEELMDIVGSEENRGLIVNGVVDILGKNPRGNYMECSKLSTGLKRQLPELVEYMKQRLQKGWLKRILADCPQLVEVDVEGVNEPCFSLSDAKGPFPAKKPLSGAIVPYSGANANTGSKKKGSSDGGKSLLGCGKGGWVWIGNAKGAWGSAMADWGWKGGNAKDSWSSAMVDWSWKGGPGWAYPFDYGKGDWYGATATKGYGTMIEKGYGGKSPNGKGKYTAKGGKPSMFLW